MSNITLSYNIECSTSDNISWRNSSDSYFRFGSKPLSEVDGSFKNHLSRLIIKLPDDYAVFQKLTITFQTPSIDSIFSGDDLENELAEVYLPRAYLLNNTDEKDDYYMTAGDIAENNFLGIGHLLGDSTHPGFFVYNKANKTYSLNPTFSVAGRQNVYCKSKEFSFSFPTSNPEDTSPTNWVNYNDLARRWNNNFDLTKTIYIVPWVRSSAGFGFHDDWIYFSAQIKNVNLEYLKRLGSISINYNDGGSKVNQNIIEGDKISAFVDTTRIENKEKRGYYLKGWNIGGKNVPLSYSFGQSLEGTEIAAVWGVRTIDISLGGETKKVHAYVNGKLCAPMIYKITNSETKEGKWFPLGKKHLIQG